MSIKWSYIIGPTCKSCALNHRCFDNIIPEPIKLLIIVSSDVETFGQTASADCFMSDIVTSRVAIAYIIICCNRYIAVLVAVLGDAYRDKQLVGTEFLSQISTTQRVLGAC